MYIYLFNEGIEHWIGDVIIFISNTVGLVENSKSISDKENWIEFIECSRSVTLRRLGVYCIEFGINNELGKRIEISWREIVEKVVS